MALQIVVKIYMRAVAVAVHWQMNPRIRINHIPFQLEI
jgi:hypothetical protein